MHSVMKSFKKVLAVMLCLSFLSVIASTELVQAAKAPTESKEAYINRCYYSIQSLASLNPRPQVIAYAYLVGEDNMAAASWHVDSKTGAPVTHEMYAVDLGTEIQGHVYPSKYYPQDNMEYLRDLKDNYINNFAYTGRIYSVPEGTQYLEREGCMFSVVACDEKWVTIWDSGYQQWSVYSSSTYGAPLGEGCQNTADVYMETHPAGFYKIQRSKVWIDFGLKENHPYNSEAAIPKAGNGLVTKLVSLRAVPDEEEKQYTPVYALTTNTEVNVVSSQLVSSKTPGSTVKYYKVSFNGSSKVQNNQVGYLKYKVPGVYYLDSRYLNFTPKGTKTPNGAVPGVITNTTKNGTVYIYPSKDTNSKYIGIASLDAEIEMFPSESDANWTTVFFGGKKAYVQTKNIKKGLYKVTDISKLYPADIVNEKIKMSWKAGKNIADYSCSIVSSRGKVLWSNKHYKKNTLTIKRKYIEKDFVLTINVRATDKNGKKGKQLSYMVSLPMQTTKLNKKYITVGKNQIKSIFKVLPLGESLQYSTNKKFKKAVLVEKSVKKGKGRVYKQITTIKKLKKNKTYYIRRRTKKEISTTAGKKWLSGKWSKSIKIRTKK